MNLIKLKSTTWIRQYLRSKIQKMPYCSRQQELERRFACYRQPYLGPRITIKRQNRKLKLFIYQGLILKFHKSKINLKKPVIDQLWQLLGADSNYALRKTLLSLRVGKKCKHVAKGLNFF